MKAAPIYLSVSVQCAGVPAWRLRLLAAVASLLSIPVVTCGRLDGQPMAVDADGLIHGEPLNLADAQRAALPPLAPLDSDAPHEFVIAHYPSPS